MLFNLLITAMFKTGTNQYVLTKKNLIKAIYLIIAVFAIFHQGSAQTPWVWRSVNLQGMGYVTGLLIHPDITAAPNLMYVRTDVGGAYRWDTVKEEWVQLFDNLSVLQRERLVVESIALDKKLPNRIYAASSLNVLYGQPEHGDVLVSDTRGATWVSTGMAAQIVYMGGNDFYRGSTGERLAVDPKNSNVLYFGSRKDGLWVKNGSSIWAKVGNGLPATQADPGCTFVIFDGTSSLVNGSTGTFYVGVYGSGVWRSTDAGTSFSRIGTDTNPLRAALGSDGILYVTFGGKEDSYGGPGALRKYAAGVWSDITPHGVYGRSYSGITVDGANAAHILVQTNLAEMHKSTDRGQTWTDVPMNFTWYPSYYWNTNWYEWGTAALVIDPNDGTGNTAYTTNGFGVGMSTNVFGVAPTWIALMKNLEEYCGIAVKAPPVVGGARLFTGQWDGIGHRVTNPDSIPDTRFAFPDNKSISKGYSIDYCQLQPSCMAWVGYDQVNSNPLSGYSSDNGITWRSLRSHFPGKGGIICLSAITPARMVWYPDNGGNGPMYSTDTGATWSICSGLPSAEWYRGWSGQTIASDRVNGLKFYMLHDDNNGVVTFYRSIDGGGAWIKTAASFPGAAGWCINATVKTNPVREEDVWVAMHPNGNISATEIDTKFKLWHSTNGGNSFVAIANVNAAYSVTMGKGAVVSEPYIYIYGKANNDTAEAFYRSTNNGSTWIRLSDPLIERWPGVTAMEGDLLRDNVLYVARGGCRGFMYGTPQGITATEPKNKKTNAHNTGEHKRYQSLFFASGSQPLLSKGKLFNIYGRLQHRDITSKSIPTGILILAP